MLRNLRVGHRLTGSDKIKSKYYSSLFLIKFQRFLLDGNGILFRCILKSYFHFRLISLKTCCYWFRRLIQISYFSSRKDIRLYAILFSHFTAEINTWYFSLIWHSPANEYDKAWSFFFFNLVENYTCQFESLRCIKMSKSREFSLKIITKWKIRTCFKYKNRNFHLRVSIFLSQHVTIWQSYSFLSKSHFLVRRLLADIIGKDWTEVKNSDRNVKYNVRIFQMFQLL